VGHLVQLQHAVDRTLEDCWRKSTAAESLVDVRPVRAMLEQALPSIGIAGVMRALHTRNATPSWRLSSWRPIWDKLEHVVDAWAAGRDDIEARIPHGTAIMHGAIWASMISGIASSSISWKQFDERWHCSTAP